MFAPVTFDKLEHFLRHFQNIILTDKMCGSNSTFHYDGSKSLNVTARLKLELGHLQFHKSNKPSKYSRYYLIWCYLSMPLKQLSITSYVYIYIYIYIYTSSTCTGFKVLPGTSSISYTLGDNLPYWTWTSFKIVLSAFW